MAARDKRFYREMKRNIKHEGNKRRRAYYKKNLSDNPEEAHLCDDYDFGEMSSKPLNGYDKDATRKKQEELDSLPELERDDAY